MNIDIEQRFIDEADRQIAAEEQAARLRLVRERAIKLQGEARRIDAGSVNLPTNPAAAKQALADKRAELASILGPPAHRHRPGETFIAQFPRIEPDGAYINRLRGEIYELEKIVGRFQQAGLLPAA